MIVILILTILGGMSHVFSIGTLIRIQKGDHNDYSLVFAHSAITFLFYFAAITVKYIYV